MNSKTKRNILYITSVLVQIMPLIIAFSLNWSKYVGQKSEESQISMGFSLTIGGAMCLTLIVLSLLDKLPKPNGLIFPVIVFAIVCFLEPILIDLKLLLGMYVLGKALDVLFFMAPIKKLNKKIADEATAKETVRQFQLIQGDKK